MTTQTGIEALPLAPTGPLPAMLAPHLEAIRALCREYEVVRLEVFGSALTPKFDPETSDVDFLVEYPPGHDLGPWMCRHTELVEQLAELLHHPVDLVMLSAVRKPRFIEAVRDNRRLLFSALPNTRPAQATGDGGVFTPVPRGSLPADVQGMLEDLLEAEQLIASETAGLTYERFAADRKIHAVVECNVIKMGAAVSRLRRHAPVIAARLPGPDWVALREDLIVHYDVIDYPALWQAATVSLPVLRAEVEALLREQGGYSAG